MSEGVSEASARRGACPEPKRSALAWSRSLKSRVMRLGRLGRDDTLGLPRDATADELAARQRTTIPKPSWALGTARSPQGCGTGAGEPPTCRYVPKERGESKPMGEVSHMF